MLADQVSALAKAATFDPMGTGKGMKDWWMVPAGITKSDTKLKALFAASFAIVAALPPKAKKSAKKARPTKPKR